LGDRTSAQTSLRPRQERTRKEEGEAAGSTISQTTKTEGKIIGTGREQGLRRKGRTIIAPLICRTSRGEGNKKVVK